MQTSQRDLWERFPVIYAYGDQTPQSLLLWGVTLWPNGDLYDGGFKIDDEDLRHEFDTARKTPSDAVMLFLTDEKKTSISTVSEAVARILRAAKAKLSPEATLTIYIRSAELTVRMIQSGMGPASKLSE